jgi:ribA/ribD-fused uncharacterized protein
MSDVGFWGRKQPCFFLSNFAPAKFILDDKEWRTTEHYYQAQKTFIEEEKELIRSAPSPRIAADLGRNIGLRSDWDKVKDEVMKKALYAKFTQNNDFKQSLLMTGDDYLFEASPYDSYWGVGGTTKDAKGKNKLGIFLMELREKLKKE